MEAIAVTHPTKGTAFAVISRACIASRLDLTDVASAQYSLTTRGSCAFAKKRAAICTALYTPNVVATVPSTLKISLQCLNTVARPLIVVVSMPWLSLPISFSILFQANVKFARRTLRVSAIFAWKSKNLPPSSVILLTTFITSL